MILNIMNKINVIRFIQAYIKKNEKINFQFQFK